MDFDIEKAKANLKGWMRRKHRELLKACRIASTTAIMSEIGDVHVRFMTGQITPTQLDPDGYKLKVEMEFQLTPSKNKAPD